MNDSSIRPQLDALVAMSDTAMVVVTVAHGHEHGGCLVGFHAQSSIEPWRYTVRLGDVADFDAGHPA